MALVKIICGGKNSGKTTLAVKLAESYRKKGIKPAGILSVSDDKNKKLYHFLDLSTGDKIPAVSELPLNDNDGWKKRDFSRFYFSDSAFEASNRILELTLNDGTAGAAELVFVDELGPLELSGSGNFKSVKKLLRELNGTLILVIRETLVEKFTAKLEIDHFEIIRPNQAQ